ncbi:MAG: hypothetical protein RIQ64_1153 [Actinomycetota bacterium]
MGLGWAILPAAANNNNNNNNNDNDNDNDNGCATHFLDDNYIDDNYNHNNDHVDDDRCPADDLVVRIPQRRKPRLRSPCATTWRLVVR